MLPRNVVKIVAAVGAAALTVAAMSSIAGAAGGPKTTLLPGMTIFPNAGPVVPGATLTGIRSDNLPAVLAATGPLGLLRIFHSWGQTCDKQEQNAVAAGQLPFTSFKARTPSGAPVTYASITAGTYDSYITAVAQSCMALGVPVWVAFNHEASQDLVDGSAAQYQAAFDHWVTVFRAAGASSIKQVVIYTNKSFPGAVSYSAAVDASAWYPGDGYVDIIGDDVYNAWKVGDPAKRWRTVTALAAPFAAWSAPHAKGLVLPEFGSIADPASAAHRAAWIVDAGVWAKANHLLAVSYFDVLDTSANRDWRLDSDPTALAAYRTLAGN